TPWTPPWRMRTSRSSPPRVHWVTATPRPITTGLPPPRPTAVEPELEQVQEPARVPMAPMAPPLLLLPFPTRHPHPGMHSHPPRPRRHQPPRPRLRAPATLSSRRASLSQETR